MAKVSVIIPVYNAQKYLRRCLDSVLHQTLKDLQIILVNDSSTDDSLRILEEYAALDPRITVVSQENAGAGAARNRGLDLAQGEYLSFLDADDFFEPDMLEKAYERAARDRDDFVVFRSDQFRSAEHADAAAQTGGRADGTQAGADGKEKGARKSQDTAPDSASALAQEPDEGEFVEVAWVVREKALPPYQPFNYRALTDNVFKVFVGWAWDKLYNRQFVLEHQLRFQEQRTSNDLLFVFSALVLAKRIGYLPDVLAHQRRDSADSLSKTRENSWWCFHDALTALRERLKEEGLYEELEKDYINYCLHFTLWNYNSLAEPTKSLLRDKLNNEWFDEFGISGHDGTYYYNKGEYRQYLDISGKNPKQAGTTGREKPEKGFQAMLRGIGRAVRSDEPVPVEGRTAPVQAWKVGAALLEQEKSAAQTSADTERQAGVTTAVSADGKTEKSGTPAPATDRKTTSAGKNQPATMPKNFPVRKPGSFWKRSVRADINLLLAQNEALARQQEMLRRQLKDHHEKMAKHSFDNGKKIDAARNFMSQEWQRRDDWPLREAENRIQAQGRPVWVIKCPAPDDETRTRWGDYPFAMSLKKNLEKLGIYVVLDFRQDWSAPEGAQVVLVLRGASFYRPDRREKNRDVFYIMWNISHPDDVTDYEYGLYDVVCVGSKSYAHELSGRLKVPVYPLQQCTDTDIFCPAATKMDPVRDYIFIGNSRGIARQSVMWAIEDHLPLRIWGSGWDRILADHMDLIEAPMIANDKIPDLYRTSRVCLNDHWADMLRRQFVNNRIFDALACGLPVISDTCQELKDIFPEAVLHYTDRAEFETCVRRIRQDYTSVKACVDEQFPLIDREFSFKARAQQLVQIVKDHT